MNVATAKKMLAGLDHPTTAARINKRLEAIAAGRGAHKPTVAHPYRDCFTGEHYRGHIVGGQYRGRSAAGMQPNWIGEDGTQSCEEYIRQCEAAKLEARAAA